MATQVTVRERIRKISPIFLILGAAFVAFCPSLSAPFHLDDYNLLSDTTITASSSWWHIWRPLQTRPLTYFTFWLNYQLSGTSATSYHAVNLALHLLAVWLLYGVVLRHLGEKVALIAAAVFALHPIQTEPIVYVFERATLLAVLFCLLCLRAWIDGRYWRAAGWFGLALLSKEECVAFPIFLLLFQQNVRAFLGMLCMSSAAGARVLLSLKILHIRGAGAQAGVSPIDYLSTQGTVILRYFRLFLIPYGFSCDPDITVVRDWRAWVSWAAIILLAVVLWKRYRYGKLFAAGLILLAPSSTIFPAEDLAADRRMYLPMLVFAMLAGLILSHIKLRRATIPWVAALAILSFVRARTWSSEQAIWAEAVERAPKKLRPRVLLARASDIDEALTILSTAEEIAPRDPRPSLEKGLRLMQAQRADLALPLFQRALSLAPNDLMALNNYGTALARLGRREAAIEQFRRALMIDPCWASARTNLQRLGDIDPVPCKPQY